MTIKGPESVSFVILSYWHQHKVQIKEISLDIHFKAQHTAKVKLWPRKVDR